MTADLDSIPIQPEDQKEWWLETRDELPEDEQEELFEKIVDSDKDSDRYRYGTVAVGITLEPDEPEAVIENLERLHGLLDRDLSWGPALNCIPDFLDVRSPELCEKVYYRLRGRSDAVYEAFGADFLTAGNSAIDEEIRTLLSSGTETDIAVGLKAAEQEYADLPDGIISQVHTLFDQEACLDTLIWFASRYLDKDYGFWQELVALGKNRPEKLPRILRYVEGVISDEHLADYLQLLRIAIEKDQNPDHWIRCLPSEFAHRTEPLVDFTVWLIPENRFKTWGLAEQVSKKNPEYLTALFDRLDEFDQLGAAIFTLIYAGRPRPTELVELTLKEFDEEDGWFYRELLRLAVGELFDDERSHRETVSNLYDFLEEQYAEEPFVPDLERDRVGLDNEDAYDEERALELLKEFLLKLPSRKDYSETLLDQLDEYDSLSTHFEDRVREKLEQEKRHPIMDLLRNESQILDLLEDNWDSIPPGKRDDLRANVGFTDFLSEIKFLIALNDSGVPFKTEVPLTPFKEEKEVGDVDVVIEDFEQDIYIDILHPKMWLPLYLSNKGKGIPNNAESKILDKFRDKFLNTKEMSTHPCFIALDISRSEIDEEDVIAALHGGLQLKLWIDKDTGEAVDERLTRNPDQRLEGAHYFLDTHLNGVIWYQTELAEEGGEVKPVIKGDVIPNPEHLDGETNSKLCQSLDSRIFS